MEERERERERESVCVCVCEGGCERGGVNRTILTPGRHSTTTIPETV